MGVLPEMGISSYRVEWVWVPEGNPGCILHQVYGYSSLMGMDVLGMGVIELPDGYAWLIGCDAPNGYG